MGKRTYGIDAAAHRAALAAGGVTVALLAGGVDRLYPLGNSELLERMMRTGLVMSEAPFGTAPTAFRFLARNRLIAAVSRATVVVEAGARSGTLNTARHARDLGRPLGAVPGPVSSAASVGCHRLIREEGAECLTGVADTLALAGLQTVSAELELPPDPRYRRVIDALSTRAVRTVAQVAARCGMSHGETSAVLGLLLLQERVRRSDAGWLAVRRSV